MVKAKSKHPFKVTVDETDLIKLKSHTIDMVSFDESTTPFSHYNTVRVAVADEIVLQDGVPSSADVHAPPLVLSDYVIWKF